MPRAHAEAGFGLGGWLLEQRGAGAAGTLAPPRRRELAALTAVAKPRAAAWDRHFDAVAAFRNSHGHAAVPARHEVGGLKIGQWCVSQRRRHRQGALDADRVRRLETLGFPWAPRAASKAATADAYAAALAVFVAREGHDRVPKRHREAGLRLGEWCYRARRRRREGVC